MFSKLKKPPLSLNSVSNALKNSKTSDLSPSADALPKHIAASIVSRIGLPPLSVTASAHDPVQSLLALATEDGFVRVYGQHTTEVVFEFKLAAITYLAFVKGVYLVAALATGPVSILSLAQKLLISTVLVSGQVSACASDYSLDWLALGTSNGQVVFVDIDRQLVAPYRIDNLQKQVSPKLKLSPVTSIQWHPRDISTVLISYSHCAIVYSLARAEIIVSVSYTLTPAARSFARLLDIVQEGKRSLFSLPKSVVVPIVEAHFHPNGLHLVTLHCDNALVFWDAVDGSLLEARLVTETSIHMPGAALDQLPELRPLRPTAKWICAADPEVTMLVVANADPDPTRLSVLDFGYTLKYSLTSHEKQSKFYQAVEGGIRHVNVNFPELRRTSQISQAIWSILPIAADNCPYFLGGHNPSHLLLITSTGLPILLQYPLLTSKIHCLVPPSLAMVDPPVSYADYVAVPRTDWFGIVPHQQQSAPAALLIRGGAPCGDPHEPRALGDDENSREILVTGHERAKICWLDVSRLARLRDEQVQIAVDLSDTLYAPSPAHHNVLIVKGAYDTKDLLVAFATGEVVWCHYGKRPGQGPSNTLVDYEACPVQHKSGPASLLNILDRWRGPSTSAFLPMLLLNCPEQGAVVAMAICGAGFAAVSYSSGLLVVFDFQRGPGIVYADSIMDSLVLLQSPCTVTSLEFSVIEYGVEGFALLVLVCGTSGGGNLAVFKLVPLALGAFKMVLGDKSLGLNHRLLAPDQSRISTVISISAVNGTRASASRHAFSLLAQGLKLPGYLVVAGERDLRVLKCPKQKLAHKLLDDECFACDVVSVPGKGVVLACILKLGFVKLLSLPALSDIVNIKLSKEICASMGLAVTGHRASLASLGLALLRCNETEFAKLVIGSEPSSRHQKPLDVLFNENAIYPPRPVAGALLWAKGQATMTLPQDLALLIAGPNRKPAKHDESRLAANLSPENNPQKTYGMGPASTQELPYKQPVRGSAVAGNSGGFGAPGFMRTVQQGLNQAEETFQTYASTVGDAVAEQTSAQKKSVYSLMFKSKFGL